MKMLGYALTSVALLAAAPTTVSAADLYDYPTIMRRTRAPIRITLGILIGGRAGDIGIAPTGVRAIGAIAGGTAGRRLHTMNRLPV